VETFKVGFMIFHRLFGFGFEGSKAWPQTDVRSLHPFVFKVAFIFLESDLRVSKCSAKKEGPRSHQETPKPDSARVISASYGT